MTSHLWAKAQLCYTKIMEQTTVKGVRGERRGGVTPLTACARLTVIGHCGQGPN
jgi:hypothetical protein